MKLIKEEEEKRRDYIFQKDKKTIWTARFIVIVLVVLIVAVFASYLYINK